MTEVSFHQLAYSPAGRLLKTLPKPDDFDAARFWFDAWWHETFPKSCAGLTYLDIGCAEGLYPLRFAQRGGVAIGLNPNEVLGEFRETRLSRPGEESGNALYRQLKEMYPGDAFTVISGGFNNDSSISPDLGVFDYVSCMNCLEYLLYPKTKVLELFKLARKQVVITTDASFGETKETPEFSPMLRQLSVRDIESWSPWPVRVMTREDIVRELSFPQLFLVARADGDFSDLPTDVSIDPTFQMSATQRYFNAV